MLKPRMASGPACGNEKGQDREADRDLTPCPPAGCPCAPAPQGASSSSSAKQRLTASDQEANRRSSGCSSCRRRSRPREDPAKLKFYIRRRQPPASAPAPEISSWAGSLNVARSGDSLARDQRQKPSDVSVRRGRVQRHRPSKGAGRLTCGIAMPGMKQGALPACCPA